MTEHRDRLEHPIQGARIENVVLDLRLLQARKFELDQVVRRDFSQLAKSAIIASTITLVITLISNWSH